MKISGHNSLRGPFRHALLLLGMLLGVQLANAQGWGSATALMQGERIARTDLLMDRVLKAESDTTAWLAFGTHSGALAGERPYAPTRFTLFARLDTAGVPHAASPSVTLAAQLALSDTTVPYEQLDGSLELAPASAPLTVIDPGQAMVVPIYGGGWVRFIASSADTVQLRLDLWRVR